MQATDLGRPGAGAVAWAALIVCITVSPRAEGGSIADTRGQADSTARAAADSTAPRRVRRWRRDGYNGLRVGLQLSFFHYDEKFPQSEIEDLAGGLPVVGEPKSTEYGLCEGLELEFVGRVPRTPLYVRPNLGVTLGLGHRYDGSTQPKDTVLDGQRVVLFEPLTSHKSNYFFTGGLQVGVGYFARRLGMGVSSGIDARLWSRTFASIAVEYYYWVNVPFTVWVQRLASSGWHYGLEAQVMVLLGGEMHFVAEQRGVEYVKAPPVTLSETSPFAERVSYRVRIPFGTRVAETLSLRIYPWLETYRFGRSNTATQFVREDSGWSAREFYEPASLSWWFGVGLDVMFHTRKRVHYVAWAPAGAAPEGVRYD